MTGAGLTLVIGNRNYSSWSMRPWLVLRHFEIEFDELRIPLDTPEFPSAIAAHSPTRQVPVLKHGDLTIWDSLAIVEYLADVFCSDVWPADVQARATARSVSAEMHSGFESLRKNLPMNVRGSGRPERMTDMTLADIRRVEEIWQSCLAKSGGPFLFGDFCGADAMYAPVVSRLLSYGVVSQSAGYLEAISELPAYRQWASLASGEPETIAATDALMEAVH